MERVQRQNLERQRGDDVDIGVDFSEWSASATACGDVGVDASSKSTRLPCNPPDTQSDHMYYQQPPPSTEVTPSPAVCNPSLLHCAQHPSSSTTFRVLPLCVVLLLCLSILLLGHHRASRACLRAALDDLIFSLCHLIFPSFITRLVVANTRAFLPHEITRLLDLCSSLPPSPSASSSLACPVCLESYTSPHPPTSATAAIGRLAVFPCRHSFHRGCIEQWLESGGTYCPFCHFDLRPLVAHFYLHKVPRTSFDIIN